MSTTRMAGEELEKNPTLHDRFGEEHINNISQAGQQHETAQGYSRQELAAEFRYGDESTDDKIKEYQGLADSGARFNNAAKDFLKNHGVTFGGGGNGGGEAPSPEEPPTGGKPPANPTEPPSNPLDPPGHIFPPIGGINQTVNQDNDINSEVNGDGNTVNIGQDNSVTQSAGFGKSGANRLMDKYVLNLRQNR